MDIIEKSNTIQEKSMSLSQDELNNIQESLYLSSIPEYINQTDQTIKEDWEKAWEYNKDEEW